MLVRAPTLSTLEVEARGSGRNQSNPQLHKEFEARLCDNLSLKTREQLCEMAQWLRHWPANQMVKGEKWLPQIVLLTFLLCVRVHRYATLLPH